ncbi:aldo/keto reductase [Thermotomaculum hydrothermale]|uniref:Aldo/keto reductase n=1 Tax=Thermotomaculum hydrothermale TaxID=981385 RepID=A0A7R6PWV2_9BACT|nr:aldo/keto reductase [Thermotomaculum hydrothermale]BBB32120.1 aldo/keto reductase [Thermotomaculum hydrothermale]
MNDTVLIGGSWTIGEWHWGKVKEKDAIETIEVFLDKYKFIDTAPIYGFGRSEKLIGESLKNFKRQNITIMTKFGLNTEGGEFFFETSYRGKPVRVYKNANPDTIFKECEKSLKRLNTDYIDIYLLHFKPENPSLIKIAETLELLKEKKLIKKWGVCNLNTGDLHSLISNKFKPYCLQFKYNPLFTKPEKSVIPYCKKYKIKFFGYSPFERGLLTGKYLENKFDREDERRFIKNEKLQKFSQLANTLKKISANYNLTIPQLILNYLKTKNINGIIAGARTPKQAKENIEKFNIELNIKDIKLLNEVFESIKI